MYKNIKTVEDAIAAHPDKMDLQKVTDALNIVPEKIRRGMMALLILQAACFVVNNDDANEPLWEPDYNNDNQKKWFPWYLGGDKTGAGFRFDGALYDWTDTNSLGGARFALKDEARAEHMNEFFSDWYKELYLILE